MAMIDNTLAAQVPQFNLATTLQQGAQAQAMQQAAHEAKLRADQNAVGAEMRGLAPFVNSPDFAQRWQSTMDGLLQKGVIDQNAHDQWAKSPSALMMKSIIAKTDTPEIALRKDEDAQAQKNTQFSQGIQSQQLALQKQRLANELDPTPEGFEENPAFKTDPTQPKYRPLPGGPKDPNYLSAVAKAEADSPNGYSTTPIYGTDANGSPVLVQLGKNGKAIQSQMPDGVSLTGNSPDSIKTRATRYLDTGDDSIINPRNFSGPQGQADYRALQNEIERQRQERNMRPDEISSNKIDYKAASIGANAAARTKATRETNLDLILRAADAAIPAALEANKELPRTDFVPLNRLIQKGQVMTSDPRLVKFGMANLQLAEHWARAMNPTGVMRESDRDKALHFLDTAYGNGTYEQAVGQLRTQIEREKNAVKGSGTDYEHNRINGGRPIRVTSPSDASMYPSGTKIILPDGSPGVVP